MPAPHDALRCPRCGRHARVLDLTATTITCSACDPAWDALRHGRQPRFGHLRDDPPPRPPLR